MSRTHKTRRLIVGGYRNRMPPFHSSGHRVLGVQLDPDARKAKSFSILFILLILLNNLLKMSL